VHKRAEQAQRHLYQAAAEGNMSYASECQICGSVACRACGKELAAKAPAGPAAGGKCQWMAGAGGLPATSYY
jgi:hypothetical protein